MPLLQIPTTQFSTTIRELTEITKYANLRTHIRKIINNYFK